MLWAFSGLLVVGVLLVAGAFNAVTHLLGIAPADAATPSVTVPSPPPSYVVVPPTHHHPYRGTPRPYRRPPPAFAAVCGVGAGSHVEYVACTDPRSDLFGFAERSEPNGPTTDCTFGSDAYTRGPHYWICWSSFGLGAFVHPWATAPSPWSVPQREGGALMNIGEPKKVREIEPVDVPVPAEVPVEEPIAVPEEAPATTRSSASRRGRCQSDRDPGGEGCDLLLPVIFQRSVDRGDVDLVLAHPDQALGLEQLVHDRTDVLVAAGLFLRGHLPGLLVRLRRHLGRQEHVPRAGGKPQIRQVSAHPFDGLAETAGRAEDVQVRGRQLRRLHSLDVMDGDLDAPRPPWLP